MYRRYQPQLGAIQFHQKLDTALQQSLSRRTEVLYTGESASGYEVTGQCVLQDKEKVLSPSTM